MNVPIDYVNGLEWANTHPDLLPKPENLTIEQPMPPNCRKGVLEGPVTGRSTDQEFDPATRQG